MQKNIKRLCLGFLLILAFTTNTVWANTIFNIVPDTTSETIDPLGPGIGTPITYTVTNTTTKTISQINLTPLFQSTANPSSTTLHNDHCTNATLAPSANCTFQIDLQRDGQPTSFFLRPKVCGANNLLCSVPTENNVAQVFVPPPTPPTITGLVPSLTNRSFINIFTTKNLQITFSLRIQPSTVSSSTVNLSPAGSNNNLITSCSTTDNLTFTCPLSSTLINNQQYTLTISTGVTATNSGMLAQPYTVSFLTAGLIAGDGQNNNYFVNSANNILSVSTGGSNFTAATFAIGSPTGITDLIAGDAKGRMYFTTSTNQIWQNTITSNSIVFVSDASTARVYSCTVNTNGTFNTCTATTGFATPLLMALNPANTFLYVTNNASQVLVCPINTNGSLGSCVGAGFTATPNSSIIINPAGTVAYITALGTGVNYCTIGTGGALSNCTAANLGFTDSNSLAIDPAGANLYTNTLSNELASCPILPGGGFGSCVVYAPTLGAINSLAVNPDGTFLYVANGSNIDYCSINGGVITVPCTAVTETFLAEGLSINPAGTVLYAATNSTTVQACLINSDGSLGTCTSTGSGGATFTRTDGVANFNINTGATTGIPTSFTHPTVGTTGNIVALGGGASNANMYFATDMGQLWRNSAGGTFAQVTLGSTPTGTITQIVSDGVSNFCFITSTSQLWCGTGTTFTHIIPGFTGNIISLAGTINSVSTSATPISFYTDTNQVWQQHSVGATTFDLATSLSGLTGDIVQMSTDGLLNTYVITSTNQVWRSASNGAYALTTLTGTPSGAPVGMAGIAGYTYFSNFGASSLWQSTYGNGPFTPLTIAYLGLISGYAGQFGNYITNPGTGFYYTAFVDTNNETWGSMPTTATQPPFLTQGSFALLTHP
jgi:6-phosphogluconolactonase (cycloisomerase 2 family)